MTTLQSTYSRTPERSAKALILLLVLLSDIAFNWLYVQVLQQPFEALYANSQYALPPLAVLSLLKFGFVIMGVMFWIGRVSPKAVGLSFEHLKNGLTAVCLIWGLIHVVQVIAYLTSESPLFSSLLITKQNPLLGFGAFAAFMLTKGLVDEIIYRSLLIPNLLHRIQRWFAAPYAVLLGTAIFTSQALYVLIQTALFPIHGEDGFLTSLFWMAIVSLLSTFIYIRTGNIFIAAGIHTLWFFPVLLMPPMIPFRPLLTTCAILVAAFWPMLAPAKPTKTRRRFAKSA